MNKQHTALFNLQELVLDDHELLLEFYAGDIFDIFSDVLILSAFRGGFIPIEGTTWGSLHQKTGLGFQVADAANQTRFSENIVGFNIPENDFFYRLFALEMVKPGKNNSFTLASLKSCYKELGKFLENYKEDPFETVSLPLMGTGNQSISLADSITELLHILTSLKTTRLRIIRIFANNFRSISSLNLKINELFHRKEPVKSQLLNAALEELNLLETTSLTSLSIQTVQKLISLAGAEHATLNPFGIAGRIYAETLTLELCHRFKTEEIPSTLHLKIAQLTPHLKVVRPYVISYLRLLQNYGNLSAHAGNAGLNHQDAAAIIIAVVRIIDFYEWLVLQPSPELSD
jgi:hypothetical protein